MSDRREQLELQCVTESVRPTQALIDGYTAEIAAREAQLVDDLAMYYAKLGDLNQLDPLDFTGLGKLYRAHVAQIEDLLKEFDNAGDTP